MKSVAAESSGRRAGKVSLRARLLNGYLRRRVKPRLREQPTDPTAIDIARRRMEATARAFAPATRRFAISAGEAGGVPVEQIVTRAQPPEPAPKVLYVHGGAFTMGSPLTHRAITTALAAGAGARVIAADYRLAPEHPWPAGLNDVLTVYRHLLDQGTSPRRLVLAGDSAGGNLVLSALHGIRDRGLPMPAAGVCLSPWSDLAGTGESLITHAAVDAMLPAEMLPDVARLYAGSASLTDPAVSPLYGDFTGFPPMLLHVGSSEILTDDALRVDACIRAAGGDTCLTVWRQLPHVFHIFAAFLPEGRVALNQICAFIRDRTVARR